MSERRMLWGLSVDNLLVTVTILLTFCGFIYEGGRIQATLEQSIKAEHEIRETEFASLNTKFDEMRQDLRELRSYMMVKAQYPSEAYKR
jgi:hypothetical protein